MEIRLKPLFDEKEETVARRVKMHPMPAALTADHAAEAEHICEKVLRRWIRKRRAFTALDLFYVAGDRFIKAGKPWLSYALPRGWHFDLARKYIEAAGGEVRVVEVPDWQPCKVYCPSERACRAWLRNRLRRVLGIASGRRAKGKPGRPPKGHALERFIVACRRRNPSITWAEIAGEWNYDHANNTVNKESVRSVERRRRARLLRRKPK